MATDISTLTPANTLSSGTIVLVGVPSSTDASKRVFAAVSPSALGGSGGGATASTALPFVDGVASAGTSSAFSRGDHVHPTDTTRAPLTSPQFVGSPTAPTPAAGNVSTLLATTAFVSTAISGLSTGGGGTSGTGPAAATTAPLADGAATVGVSPAYARADHVHPTDTTRALAPQGRIATTAAFAMASTDLIVTIERTTPAAGTVTLPASPIPWQQYVIKDSANNAGTYNTTITAANSADLIDYAATYLLDVDTESVTLFHNTRRWCVA